MLFSEAIKRETDMTGSCNWHHRQGLLWMQQREVLTHHFDLPVVALLRG
jgi:hypothetical protein